MSTSSSLEMSSIAQVATLTSNTETAEVTPVSQATQTTNVQTASTFNDDDSPLSSTASASQVETGAAQSLAPGLTVDSSGKLVWVSSTSDSETDVQVTSTSHPLSQASDVISATNLVPTSTADPSVESSTSQLVSSSVSVSKDILSDSLQSTSSKTTISTNSVGTTKSSVADVSFRIATTSSQSTTATEDTKSAITSAISVSASTTKAASSGSRNTSGGLMAIETGTTSISKSKTLSDTTLTTSATATSSVSLNDGLTDVSTASMTSSGTDSSSSQATFVSDGVTLTGQDAVAALAAEQTSSASVSSGNASSGKASTSDDKSLSSLAIVGIIGGVLVALIVVYIGWYQWRKKKVRKSLGDEISDGDDDDDEKQESYDHRQTRSSFGVDGPLTPARSHRRRRRRSYEDEYGATWYDGEPEIPYRPETEYEYEGGEGGDGRTEYALTQYGDGMTAALADGMITGTAAVTEAEGEGLFADASAHNPFVPVPPVPRVPSAYHPSDKDTTHAPQYEDGERETAYGASIYDAYTGAGVDESRRQTQMTVSEPSTSKLLPWLNKGVSSNVPPVPPIPQQQQQYETNEWVQPPPQSQGRARAPPRPIMAQTPMAQRGNSGTGWGGQAPFPVLR